MKKMKERYLFDDFDDYRRPLKPYSNVSLGLHKDNKGKRMMYDNAFLSSGMTYSGQYNMPNVVPYFGEKPNCIIPYNTAHRERFYDHCIHFFIDDWYFECIWRRLNQFAKVLRSYKWVAAPDFSMYMDNSMKAINIYNVYRNRFVTSYFQQQGVNIIPSISCGNPESIDYCLDGMPKGGIFWIGNVGMAKDEEHRKYWRHFVSVVEERLHPKELLIYGSPIKLPELHTPVSYYKEYINTILSYDK